MTRPYRRFTRVHIIDFAKCIRNATISNASRILVAREFADYFDSTEPIWDRKMFMQIASGIIEDDPKTKPYSILTEKSSEKV